MTSGLGSARSILITGGAGFLGRGIIRRLVRDHSSAQITVYSRDEHKHHALRARYPHIRTLIGDVRDLDRLSAVMIGHDTVLHLAAMKHIPEAERDVSEAVATNVDGTRAVVLAAMRTGVEQVVGISTDKATSPRNAYGATKMLMERLFQEAQRLTNQTRFTTVRYGNVVSSTGSVVPLFREQIRRDGRVTITSPSMTRFWISIDGAVDLIDKALSSKGQRGHVYVARCDAMTILALAQTVWNLEGREGEVQFEITGVRPGEKLHETLIDAYEAPFSRMDGPYVVIPPTTSFGGESTSEVMPYESSHPASWLTPIDMMALIADSETV